MKLGIVRRVVEQGGKHRSSPGPSQSDSIATQPSDASLTGRHSKVPSDTKILNRARDALDHVDVKALAAGPNAGGPWKRVEAVDRFVIFRQEDKLVDSVTRDTEVLCAGRLDASIEEVAAILCPLSEAEHNAVMKALYGKRFLCGSVERTIPCSGDTMSGNSVNGQELTVKTSTFARSTMFGPNEQWCYTNMFQRKEECDGFVISQQSLPVLEHTPGRMIGAQDRVVQLHDLAASYLVDLDPGRKGLRVVYNAKFQTPEPVRNRSASDEFCPPSPRNLTTDVESKAQSRRLLTLARGVTRIPELVRCRRFGFQVPANLDTIEVSNPRCPCCTRSLSPVKLSLSAAASAISHRSLAYLKTNTRRCYLCGYLVCVNCWQSERMESMAGRVALIVVCTRCQACVDACNYSEISSDRKYGPPRVVEDTSESSIASLLIDFLSDSLKHSTVGSTEHSTVLAVIRALLQNDQENDGDVCDDERNVEESIARVDRFLGDEDSYPLLEDCTLANADKRDYVLDLPDDPVTSVPRGPMPSNESLRLSTARDAGLLLLADQLAPEVPRTVKSLIDIRDLELICQLAAKTMDCPIALVSVMGVNHEHILASTNPQLAGAAVPRDHTMCQHQLMSQDPLVFIHPEADVRLHAIHTIKLLSLRTYVGFSVTAPTQDGRDQIAVGSLCCADMKPHPELTRCQYAMMQNLARTASLLMQHKGKQLQQRAAPA
ncbi:hypothetical protein PPTG_11443 [Phytophthora nicotianae INRA-310]|uniref:GAF domain-containing protein n=2 Tax=Phytophthora nicotianae TaxID=4792 RepID=W2Q9M0_PHYN3|nr:hypothetical protein PPTG_11443 [Phytophthora nicotianae INRA-310]ETN09868.1 hypothetical protein PPTG_11443 [Phytophthora nicotianae INRA-310]